jgi:hypothetical protein
LHRLLKLSKRISCVGPGALGFVGNEIRLDDEG